MAKTLTFAILHFSVAFGVGYALSGSALIGGAIALVEPACNTVVFYFHEKAWERFKSPRSIQMHSHEGALDMTAG